MASNSERFGECWARQWLDLARYADSNGFQADQLRDSWAYRDWVIDALNDDLPYDRFVTLQLAGDEVPDRDRSTVIATSSSSGCASDGATGVSSAGDTMSPSPSGLT